MHNRHQHRMAVPPRRRPRTQAGWSAGPPPGRRADTQSLHAGGDRCCRAMDLTDRHGSLGSRRHESHRNLRIPRRSTLERLDEYQTSEYRRFRGAA
jgi:hypothetical protein